MTFLGFLAVLGSVLLGAAAYQVASLVMWDLNKGLLVGAGVAAIGLLLTLVFL